MKTKLLAGAMALALIGCSEKSAEDAASADTASPAAEASPASDSAAAAEEATPDVGLVAAPGVAFDYSYAFRLDDDRIAKVQSDHAEACEMLGTARCRIVDVRFQMVRENEVEAQTQFKLDPGIARKFGADALASVEKAEGVLADASIAGEDVGTQIEQSQQRSAGAAAEIERIEGRLKQRGLDKSERAELQRQIADLRGQLGNERESRRVGEAKIAMTSVVFNYVGTGGLPGIGHENPFSNARDALIGSGGTLLSIVLVAGAAILPWALLAGLIAFLWRRFRGARPTEPPAPAA
ncbi:DUF4349 domain-containing protein [Sphingopyxis panaciterrae]